MAYEPVVEELIQLIQENGWKKAFEEAVREAHGAGIPEMDDPHPVRFGRGPRRHR